MNTGDSITVTEACRTARLMLTATEAEIRRRLSEAEAVGYAEGIGRALGKHKQILLDHESLTKKAENEIVEIVLEIAREVIGSELKTDPNSIISRVKSTLSKRASLSDEEIFVNPNDAPLFKDLGLSVREDNSITRGGFILRTSLGEVVSDLGEHLSRIANSMRRVLHGA